MRIERIVQSMICVIGVTTIVASGGGGGTDCFTCPNLGPFTTPLLAQLSVSPRQTVQVGSPVTITASATTLVGAGTVTFSWCRTAPAGGACVTIPGAVASTLVIASAGPADDGATFSVTATATGDGSTRNASSRLAVSSLPAVTFTDGEFADGDWTVEASIAPTTPPTTYVVSRILDGGHPGAYRKVRYNVVESGNVHAFHLKPGAMYDPASQGAIYMIDFNVDCILFTRSAPPDTTILVQQGSRRFGTLPPLAQAFECAPESNPFDPVWSSRARGSLSREDFLLVDGPACGPTEACPDFSATALPLRFGMLTQAVVNGPPFGNVFVFEHGLDNWRITIWRH